MTADVPSLTEKRLAKQEKAALIEQVLIKGDLSKLTQEERMQYYMRVCESVGLNALTKPFEYITLNGKLTLYALRSATDQLRAVHGVSVIDMDKETTDGVHIVTVKVQDAKGRTDMGTGAVSIAGLKGEALANGLMKAETKAKRRATLSICGLSLLDETEVETIPGATIVPSQAPEAGETFPQTPASRPRTNPNSSNQLKKNGAWDSFTDRIRGFVEADDVEGLKAWYASEEVQSRVAAWPDNWREQAEETFDSAHDSIVKTGRA